MKICNKRGFFNGLAFCFCCILNLVLLAVGYFQTFRWFWYTDSAVFLLTGTVLLIRALSPEKSRRDLTEKWRIGKTVIYNKYGFLDGIFLLLCAPGSLVTAISKGLGWRQNLYTVLFIYFGLDRVIRATTLEEARKDILEERDERNRMVTLKGQAMSFQITQTVSLLLMAFFILKGGQFNQLDLASAGVGAGLCFLISIFSIWCTRKYYEKRL